MNTNDQPTPSADEEIATPRIYTRCPACSNDTLTINDDKHLICTWISCPDPTLIDRISEIFPHKWEEAQRELAEVRETCGASVLAQHEAVERMEKAERELASLQSEREELIELRNWKAAAMKGRQAQENNALRAALAERDREIEKLEAQCNLLAESVQGENNAHMEALRAGQVAEETITDLRSQLQAAISRAEEAEKADRNIEAYAEKNRRLNARVLALEAHVGKLLEKLKQLRDCDVDNLTLAIIDSALSSQPDLTLIEEVRGVLRDVLAYADMAQDARRVVSDLLARLNPAE